MTNTGNVINDYEMKLKMLGISYTKDIVADTGKEIIIMIMLEPCDNINIDKYVRHFIKYMDTGKVEEVGKEYTDVVEITGGIRDNTVGINRIWVYFNKDSNTEIKGFKNNYKCNSIIDMTNAMIIATSSTDKLQERQISTPNTYNIAKTDGRSSILARQIMNLIKPAPSLITEYNKLKEKNFRANSYSCNRAVKFTDNIERLRRIIPVYAILDKSSNKIITLSRAADNTNIIELEYSRNDIVANLIVSTSKIFKSKPSKDSKDDIIIGINDYLDSDSSYYIQIRLAEMSIRREEVNEDIQRIIITGCIDSRENTESKSNESNSQDGYIIYKLNIVYTIELNHKDNSVYFDCNIADKTAEMLVANTTNDKGEN